MVAKIGTVAKALNDCRVSATVTQCEHAANLRRPARLFNLASSFGLSDEERVEVAVVERARSSGASASGAPPAKQVPVV